MNSHKPKPETNNQRDLLHRLKPQLAEHGDRHEEEDDVRHQMHAGGRQPPRLLVVPLPRERVSPPARGADDDGRDDDGDAEHADEAQHDVATQDELWQGKDPAVLEEEGYLDHDEGDVIAQSRRDNQLF